MESESLIPLSTFEDVNQQWLEKMLSLKYNISITVHSWNLTLPSGREGFLSEIAFVKILYSDGVDEPKDLQLVLKILPKDPKVRQFLADGDLARREIEFYKFATCKELQDICTKSGIALPVPEIYFAGYRKEAVTLALLDLSVQKCKSIIVKEGSTLSQTKVALQSISQVHAAGFIFMEYFKDHDILSTLSADFSTDFYTLDMVKNLNTIVELTEGTPVADTMKCLIPLEQLMFTYYKNYPLMKTIVHGDLWAGQLLNTSDASKAYVIDWQFCRVDNPVLDIAAMFFMSSNPEVLEKHMDELLTCYWESFNQPLQSLGMTSGITFEQFKKNVDDLLLFGFAILAVSIHDFLPAGNLTKKRLLCAIDFLEKKGTFKKFVDIFGNKN
ncbi:uncharacterized protein LOC135224360 isoform X2 [Macrobrachium nipponense]|uniref:uncharacterized protein LOC135224360 isoform X2 n=1 Tax=Macrobrachium nipponense TaxID=159736 RepID=UPI0030C8AB80